MAFCSRVAMMWIPPLYEEDPDPACGELCPRRDELEYALLSEALNRDVPLLGICRGAQFINAALGGSLYQGIPSQMRRQFRTA